MKKPTFDVQRVLEMVAVIGILGAIFTALNFKLTTPANALEQNTTADSVHIIAFDHHVDDFATYLDLEDLKQESRDTRTRMVEAQMRITCLETRTQTLVLADLMATCTSLGVRR